MAMIKINTVGVVLVGMGDMVCQFTVRIRPKGIVDRGDVERCADAVLSKGLECAIFLLHDGTGFRIYSEQWHAFEDLSGAQKDALWREIVYGEVDAENFGEHLKKASEARPNVVVDKETTSYRKARTVGFWYGDHFLGETKYDRSAGSERRAVEMARSNLLDRLNFFRPDPNLIKSRERLLSSGCTHTLYA